MLAGSGRSFTLKMIVDHKYRLLFEAITDYAICMLDADGAVISWNPGAEQIIGYTAEEIVGCSVACFYTREDRQQGAPQRALEFARVNGRFESEGWRVRKNNSRLWAHVIVDRILGEDGVLIGFAQITRDVTEQREAARELDRVRDELFQSQKAETIGKLTGGVAHDFNNVLMVIQSCLDTVELKLPDNAQLHRLMEKAQSAVRHGSALTQRMLAFARKQELRVRPVDVAELVAHMSELLRRSLGPMVHIHTSFPAALNPVSTDVNQLELALLNVAVNARDAMSGKGNVTFAARNVVIDAVHSTGLPPGDYVCLSITDEGEGMDEETLAKAVDPFFTTKGVGEGTGLGLSMVHGLLEQSEGRLILKSSKDFGTRVEFWLPGLPSERRSAMPAISTPSASKPIHHLDGLRILVVDDDQLVRHTTGAVLQDLGHVVTEAASAEEALRILEGDGEIDVLLTDHAMPGMTGAQLIGEVSRRWPKLPIVLATGYAEASAGLSDVATRLNKPYGRADLTAAIAKALERRRLRI